MLEVINLHFDYSDKPLLQGINFSLSDGALLHLKGANGAGKTTLLKLLAGLHQPNQGEIRFLGQLIIADLSAYLRKICYVGHKSGVSLLLTVREHCEFEMQRLGYSGSLDDLLTEFSLQGFQDIPCSLLSSGLRRRVGLLRLKMSGSKLWLLDEPLVALDHEAVELLKVCLQTHLEQGGLIVMTSHQTLDLKTPAYQDYYL